MEAHSLKPWGGISSGPHALPASSERRFFFSFSNCTKRDYREDDMCHPANHLLSDKTPMITMNLMTGQEKIMKSLTWSISVFFFFCSLHCFQRSLIPKDNYWLAGGGICTGGKSVSSTRNDRSEYELRKITLASLIQRTWSRYSKTSWETHWRVIIR